MANNYRSFLLSLSLFGAALCMQAQVAAPNYAFEQDTVIYTPIVGDTVFTNVGASSTTTYDETVIGSLPIGFPFYYSGQSFRNFKIVSNGFITFDSLASNNDLDYNYEPISTSDFDYSIAGFGEDIWAVTELTGQLTTGSNVVTGISSSLGLLVGAPIEHDAGNPKIPSGTTIVSFTDTTITLSNAATGNVNIGTLDIYSGEIQHQVIGTNPNRVSVIQWSNFALYNERDNIINFQIRLYETSNTIEFAYENFAVGSTSNDPEIGLRGLFGDFNSRLVTTDWGTSVAATSASDECIFAPGIVPDSGLVFRWITDFSIGIPSTLAANSEFTLYPNPTNGVVTIQLKANTSDLQSIEVYAADGKLARAIPVANTSGTSFQFNLSDLPKGLYLVRLNAGNSSSTQRLLID